MGLLEERLGSQETMAEALARRDGGRETTLAKPFGAGILDHFPVLNRTNPGGPLDTRCGRSEPCFAKGRRLVCGSPHLSTGPPL